MWTGVRAERIARVQDQPRRGDDERVVEGVMIGQDHDAIVSRDLLRGRFDGLKIDAAGNVWTTGPGGIRVITPQGKVLGQIKLPEVAANLAWANDGHTLYITGSTSIYRLSVASPGQMPLYTKE